MASTNTNPSEVQAAEERLMALAHSEQHYFKRCAVVVFAWIVE